MRRKLIAGNWKMNGNLAANAALLADIKTGEYDCDVTVCVPAVYLEQCQSELRDSEIALCAQDVSAHAAGAYTGEISALMLRDFACKYVLVGHSERRAYHAENNQLVAKKMLRAIEFDLIPIVCVGETLVQRNTGQTEKVVGGQLDVILAALSKTDLAHIVVAYEPVWAIGTGQTATPEVAQEVHAMLRSKLVNKDAGAGIGVRIIYGGSMRPDNAAALLEMPDVDGGLIGGASLRAVDFLGIIRAAKTK